MKTIFRTIKDKIQIIISVIVVAALVLACLSTALEDRRKVTKDKGRVVQLTALYNDAPMSSVFARTPYEAVNLTQEAVNSTGFINENVGAYSKNKDLTEQEKKDKAALEELLASNDHDGLSAGDAAKKRKEKYKLNNITQVSENTNVTFTANGTQGGSTTAVYANSSNGSYLGQFVLTGYCACVICCGKTNGITASGRKAVANHTIAADRRFAFGTQMIINGIVYTVDDRGGAITGNHIDIYFNTHAEALQFGRRTGDVYLYTGGPTTTTTVADNTSNTTTTNETVSDDPNSTPEENESNNTSSSNSVTLIGDSLTVGATSAFQSLVPSANIDGKVGRQMLAGSGIVSEMKAAGTLGDTVIIELGTNGPFSEEDGQRLIDSIGSDKRIFWMNTYGPSLSWYSQVNATISALCNNNSNVTLINWEQMGLANPGYFAGDGIHLTSAGYQAYAQLMANAIK